MSGAERASRQKCWAAVSMRHPLRSAEAVEELATLDWTLWETRSRCLLGPLLLHSPHLSAGPLPAPLRAASSCCAPRQPASQRSGSEKVRAVCPPVPPRGRRGRKACTTPRSCRPPLLRFARLARPASCRLSVHPPAPPAAGREECSAAARLCLCLGLFDRPGLLDVAGSALHVRRLCCCHSTHRSPPGRCTRRPRSSTRAAGDRAAAASQRKAAWRSISDEQ